MAHNGFGVGMPVMGVYVMGALIEQVASSPFPVVAGVAHRQITTQSINGNLQDQFWVFIFSGGWQYQSVYKNTYDKYQKKTFKFHCFFS
jgi:hypothetical protein